MVPYSAHMIVVVLKLACAVEHSRAGGPGKSSGATHHHVGPDAMEDPWRDRHNCMVIAVMSLSPLAAVNVSCIWAVKPIPVQLAWPTIVKLPSLAILPMWVALPVPAVVAVLGR